MPIEMMYAAQKGDQQAQDSLMRVLYEPVYHFMLKRTGNSEITVELCQSVFLKCFQALDSYDPSMGSVRTWIFRIARNTLFDHYRKQTTSRFDAQEELTISDPHSNTAQRAEERFLGSYVADLLAKLPDVEADVVTLKAIQEMPYEEVAAIIGRSEVATRKIYSRALAHLRALATRYPYDNNHE